MIKTMLVLSTDRHMKMLASFFVEALTVGADALSFYTATLITSGAQKHVIRMTPFCELIVIRRTFCDAGTAVTRAH